MVDKAAVEREASGVEIHALDAGRLPGAVDLFESNPTMRGCWCQYMRLKSSEVSAGWGDGNRRRFAEEDLSLIGLRFKGEGDRLRQIWVDGWETPAAGG